MGLSRHEQEVRAAMRQCVHFTGVQHDCCKAGVNYHDLLGRGPGCFAHMPCLGDDGATVQCPNAKFPTQEEAEAELKEQDEAIARTMGAVRAAHDDANRRGLGRRNGGAGKCPCPCGGTISYSVAAYNGAIAGKCDGPCKTGWME